MQTRAVVYKEKEGGTGGDFELKETVRNTNLNYLVAASLVTKFPANNDMKTK